ncbi:flagellar brake protein [Parablautia muri]|uniref:Flagellar brake protein n=1 Tax=Parablautia muri TaxID=2320879 RepID=A0A9X5BGX6_9FIRM|nr:flagellar brake protein [Parablautia muri]NBJ93494.1 flagellar brake protein [Parablautia muri]
MLLKYVEPGNKIEMQAVERAQDLDEFENVKTYQTLVLDVLSEDRLEIAMPMEKMKLILLPVNTEYDLCFYTSSGLYQCLANVIDRYKSGGQYILLMELTTNLRRHQRREYYRLSCALDMDVRFMEKSEIVAIEGNRDYVAMGLPVKHGMIVDISGGGVRFVSDNIYEQDSLIYCKYMLSVDGEEKEFMLAAKVLRVKELEDKPGMYEHRAQYININMEEREEIIRYIFEEERKIRKRKKV